MAVSVMARCGPCAMPSSSSRSARRMQQSPASGRAPFGFAQRVARPLHTPARAFYRSASNWDEEAMKEVLQDMAKMWKQAGGNVGGGFFWPGGGYVYGAGQRCKPNGGAPWADAAAAGAGSGSNDKALALDVVSTEGFYLLYADVPGLAKADLSIKLTKEPRALAISGERKAPVEEGYAQKERRFGAFERSWALPDDADSDGISAKVTEGVLTITVPKKQPAAVEEAQEIAIN